MSGKRGRARVYPRSSGYECIHDEIDEYVALTGELIERVVDQTEDLPPDALSFRPQGVDFSIAKLALHMAESEQKQLLLVADGLGMSRPATDMDDSVAAALNAHSDIFSSEEVPQRFLDGEFLSRAMRSAFRNVTVPVCRAIAEPDAEMTGRSPFDTPRAALKHMHWHWTYHSGQIGVLRLQWGDDYVWTLKRE